MLASLGVGGKISYSAKVLGISPANLIGYWKLNESSGTTANDSSGNGRHGTISGATLGQPGVGDGLFSMLFDGVNDVLALTNAYAATSGNLQTVAFWLNVQSVTSSQMTWFFQHDGNNRIFFAHNGSTVVIVRIAGGTVKSISHAINPVSSWVHVCATWSDVDGMILYINGTQRGNASAIGTFTHSAAAPYFEFAKGEYGYDWANAKAQHIAQWNSVLSAAQIASLAVV